MRRLEFAAFPLALPFLTWASDESRPDSSHAVHPFDDQICELLPPEGF
jgi:hypothetical protein